MTEIFRNRIKCKERVGSEDRKCGVNYAWDMVLGFSLLNYKIWKLHHYSISVHRVLLRTRTSPENKTPSYIGYIMWTITGNNLHILAGFFFLSAAILSHAAPSISQDEQAYIRLIEQHVGEKILIDSIKSDSHCPFQIFTIENTRRVVCDYDLINNCPESNQDCQNRKMYCIQGYSIVDEHYIETGCIYKTTPISSIQVS